MKTSRVHINAIESQLREVVKQTETEMMQLFPSMLCYDLLTADKHYITHEFDPPRDYSGMLFRSSSDRHFDVADYEKIEGFLCGYTGNSSASYISNCGLFFETYREKYTDWFECNIVTPTMSAYAHRTSRYYHSWQLKFWVKIMMME